MKQEIINYLVDTPRSLSDVVRTFSIPMELVYQIVVDSSINRCEICNYWIAPGEYEIIDTQIICYGCEGLNE
jgi:hypothetical protein